jgi:regulatory protein
MSDPKSINELNADLFQPEEVDRFADPVEARRKAMDYLARREYGHEELVRKLETAGFCRDVAQAAVDRLTEDGLQSDERYAGSFVQSRISQGKGPVRIRQELKERGLAGRTIEHALAESAEDWFALALDVRRRKFGDDRPADFAEKARQMRFLQYRGFDTEQIQAAVSANGDS